MRVGSKKAHAADWGRLLDCKKWNDSYGVSRKGYAARPGAYYLYSAARNLYFNRISGYTDKNGNKVCLYTSQYPSAKKFVNKEDAVAFARRHGIADVRPHACAAGQQTITTALSRGVSWEIYSERRRQYFLRMGPLRKDGGRSALFVSDGGMSKRFKSESAAHACVKQNNLRGVKVQERLRKRNGRTVA